MALMTEEENVGKKQLLNQITNSLKYSNQFPILLQQKRVKHNIQNVNFFLFLPTSGLSRSNTRTKIRKRNKSRREIKYVHLISFPITLRHDFVHTRTTQPRNQSLFLSPSKPYNLKAIFKAIQSTK